MPPWKICLWQYLELWHIEDHALKKFEFLKFNLVTIYHSKIRWNMNTRHIFHKDTLWNKKLLTKGFWLIYFSFQILLLQQWQLSTFSWKIYFSLFKKLIKPFCFSWNVNNNQKRLGNFSIRSLALWGPLNGNLSREKFEESRLLDIIYRWSKKPKSLP